MKDLVKAGKYYLFVTWLKRDSCGLGFDFGPKWVCEPEDQHFCTRDLRFNIGKYSFRFWIEEE